MKKSGSQKQNQMAFTKAVLKTYPQEAIFTVHDLYARVTVAYAGTDRTDLRKDQKSSVLQNNIRWFLYYATERGMLSHAGGKSALYQKVNHPEWEEVM